jgi:hypothetical protein
MSVCCECCVLSGRGLCEGLVTHPEESYRVWCVWVWSWNLEMRRPRHLKRGCWAIGKKSIYVKVNVNADTALWRRMGGVEVYMYAFLNSGLNRDKRWASRYGVLTSMERTPGNHSIRGWVAPRTAMDAVEEGKCVCPFPESNPDISGYPTHSLVTGLYCLFLNYVY